LSIFTRKHGILSVQPLWSISGNKGNQWLTAAITINEIEDFEVILIRQKTAKVNVTF
jgi:hypothetical protein